MTEDLGGNPKLWALPLTFHQTLCDCMQVILSWLDWMVTLVSPL